MECLFYAIIVTYNPDLNILKTNVENLFEQGFKIIIIDNNSNNIEKFSGLDSIKIIRLTENMGIAYALNKGMEAALQKGATWVLALDQDTKVADNLLEEYKKFIDLPNVAALSPRVIKKGLPIDNSDCDSVIEINKCPTSGFFMKTSLWDQVGRYDDWMFIDYVDYDMCAKLKVNGYHIYRVNTTYIIQNLGKIKVNQKLYKIGSLFHLKKISNFAITYNHNSIRNYYFVRNGLYYIHKYNKFIDKRYEIKFIIKWELKKLILEPNKKLTIKSIINGYKDYKNKIGREIRV